MARPTRNVLVVEDDFLLASLLEDTVKDLGYAVVGPYSGLADGLKAARSPDIDFALLDFDLGEGSDSTPIAEALAARGLEFAFMTGTDPEVIRATFAQAIVLAKPVDEQLLGRVLAGA
jgi:DNA-binding response OmpR family regulator